jgi:hypothetical protein
MKLVSTLTKSDSDRPDNVRHPTTTRATYPAICKTVEFDSVTPIGHADEKIDITPAQLFHSKRGSRTTIKNGQD